MRTADRPRFLGALCLAALSAASACAFDTSGAWPTGNIVLNLQLDAKAHPAIPAGKLTDGSTSWDAAVEAAVTLWDSYLTRCRLSSTRSTSTSASEGDGVNNVFFSDTVYGEAWGGRTLAVTLTSSRGLYGLRFTENDVLFNSTTPSILVDVDSSVSWDSYRGNLHSDGVVDIRRVAQHEFGHVLGLNHPDEADPPQSVTSIMNAVVSNVEVPQADDIAGVHALYGSALATYSITGQPQSQTVNETNVARLSVSVNGGDAPPATDTVKYAWTFTPTGGTEDFLFTNQEPELLLGPAQTYDAGTYRVAVETPDGEVQSVSAVFKVNAVTATLATRLANLSTRGIAGTGNHALIVGFVVAGTQSRRVLLRGVGPALTAYPVSSPVADPTLDLKDANGVTVASNDNWGDGDPTTLSAAFRQAGAFPLASGSADAALVATLAPGAYTALVSPKSGGEGIALVEAYDLDATDTTNRLVNLSTRGFIGTDDSILIGGLVVQGPGPRRYLLRVVGDTLQQSPYNVTGTLDDPMLLIYDGAGRLLRKVDDWDTPAFLQSTLTSVMDQVGAFPLTDRQESVLLLTLQPGNYTLHATGFGGGTGVALLEAYEVTP